METYLAVAVIAGRSFSRVVRTSDHIEVEDFLAKEWGDDFYYDVILLISNGEKAPKVIDRWC
jgi:hypothetical protein